MQFYIFLSLSYLFLLQGLKAQQRLPEAVNSPYKELMPLIAPDGKTLFFVRDGHPRNLGGQDVWVSQKKSDGSWAEAINLGNSINNEKHNILYSIAPDGSAILVTTDTPGKVGIAKLKSNQTWEKPISLNIKNFINTDKYSAYSLSVDGKILLMNIDNPESIGLQDLFVSFLQKDSSWSEPLNLGKQINTTEYEISPFLAADNHTLYFASNGHGGYGNTDLWYSVRLDDSWQKWTKPINLGKKINTEGFDAYFSIDAAGEYGYWSSSIDPKQQNDIYTLRLPDSLKPKAVVLIKGKVLNAKTQQPLQAIIQYQTLSEKNITGQAQTNPQTGEYQVILNQPKHFSLFAQAKGMFSVSQSLELKELKAYQELNLDLLLNPITKGDTISLNSLFFDTNKASLKPESYPELQRLLQLLEQNPNLCIQINGHTDDQGNATQNLKLSQDRANAIKNYLVQQNIPEQRILTKGLGGTQPIASNTTEEGRKLNRRVDFIIISK